jgi:hypothetical protein
MGVSEMGKVDVVLFFGRDVMEKIFGRRYGQWESRWPLFQVCIANFVV